MTLAAFRQGADRRAGRSPRVAREGAAVRHQQRRNVVIGFRILRRARKVDAQVVAQFREIPVANVSDSMYRMSAGGARLRPMHRGGRMAGPAFTVKTRPGDNLMVHKALDLAEPGDVIVVDAGGDLTNALIGEIMSTYARARGIAGIVIDGAIRDADEIRASDFPGLRRGRHASRPLQGRAGRDQRSGRDRRHGDRAGRPHARRRRRHPVRSVRRDRGGLAAARKSRRSRRARSARRPRRRSIARGSTRGCASSDAKCKIGRNEQEETWVAETWRVYSSARRCSRWRPLRRRSRAIPTGRSS